MLYQEDFDRDEGEERLIYWSEQMLENHIDRIMPDKHLWRRLRWWIYLHCLEPQMS